jgi:hypothetical protein
MARMTLKDATAAELADDLDLMAGCPHDTEGLWQLSAAAGAFNGLSPHIVQGQQDLTEARRTHIRSFRDGSYSETAWQSAIDAAHHLADLLRPLGEVRIQHCAAPTRWGLCDMPLDSHGTCRAEPDHSSADRPQPQPSDT